MILHKNNITQTDHYQFRCEYFEPVRMSQTFDTGPFLLSLHRTITKILKALKITLLQFLTEKNLNCMYT